MRADVDFGGGKRFGRREFRRANGQVDVIDPATRSIVKTLAFDGEE
jgi:hypothetical protein